MLKVGILGMGWLGSALAEHLMYMNFIQQSQKKPLAYELIGTQRSIKKTPAGITTLLWEHPQNIPKDFYADVVVLCTPASALNDYDALRNSIQELYNIGTKKIIYTSSTGVYEGLSGEVKEETELKETSDRQKHLMAVENIIASFENHVILRLAGLVAEDRNPANFLSGKKNISGFNQAINLVHKIDVVQIITKLLQYNFTGIMNVVSDDHPQRKEFYEKLCDKFMLERPEFNGLELDSKIVSNTKSKEILNYDYLIDDIENYFLKLKVAKR